MIKKILVGLDSTPFTDTVLRYAAELAKAHNASVTGIAIIHSKKLENVGPVPIGAGPYAKDLRDYRVSETTQHAAEVTKKFESMCRLEGIPSQVKCEMGSPIDLMISHARYHDLIILGVRNTFDYGIAEESKSLLCRLIKEGVQPILAVAEEFRPIKKVMVAYNGSIESASAMKKLAQLNLWPGVETRVVYFGKEDPASQQFLEEAREYYKLHGFRPEIACINDNVKEGLLSEATKLNADLIVMGNSDLTPLVSQFFGDATMHAIKHADRALFLAQ